MKCLFLALAGAMFCIACGDDTEKKDAAPADASTDVVVVDQTVDRSPLDTAAEVAPDDAGPLEDTGIDLGPVVPATWVTIPAGTFTMGSPSSEPCGYINETPHEVTLSRAFEIQSTETTQGQFQELMGYNPSYFSSCGNSCPVEMVDWHEAVAYCNALSDEEGLTKCYSCSGTGRDVACQDATAYSGEKIYDCPGFRLPTEAEWEYAYRAGTTTAYYNGTNDSSVCTSCTALDANADKIGWYCSNSGDKTHPVGQKAPNAWNLYDMAGNVWEWCHDWGESDLGSTEITDPWGSASSPWGRVLRGGSWNFKSNILRAAFRHFCSPYWVSYNAAFGFRCVRTK